MTKRSVFAGNLDRRSFLQASMAGAATLALSGCVTSPPPEDRSPPPVGFDGALGGYETMYGPMIDEGFSLPAVPIERMDPQFLRQVVPDPTGQPPGTVVVDTSSHFLYFVTNRGEAIRYGVGLGRAGFEWSGNAVIQWKQKWPKWTPPEEMIARDPKLAQYSAENGGMPPGLDNPLGARALYIFQNGEDTLFRLHGTPEWQSIGKSVSSGCVRLMNQDIIDLYERVPNSTQIVVTSGIGPALVASAGPSRYRRSSLPIDAGVPEGSILLGRVN